mmetsp:Transcript_20370/g.50845  ORF Transcript_20370/g.50845 Transcript_20370/m.50845 type:complete len:330 (-) Transcript_20370:587-1576(-)
MSASMVVASPVFASAARGAVRQQRDSATSSTLRGGISSARRSSSAKLSSSARRGAGLVCDAKLGIVGGSNLNDSSLFQHLEKKLVKTEYGDVVIYDSPPDAEKQICFVKRHYCGPDESYVPPHLVKAPAFLKAFKSIGVTEVLQVCSVGSLVKGHIPPHSIVFPDDYIALWNMATYATNDKSGELLPELDANSRAVALAAVKATDIPTKMKLVECGAVYVQTRGPRFETKAEVKALGVLGGDIVGMTGVSEVVLCNELRMPVSMVCFCDNYANGINEGMDAYSEFYSNVRGNMQTVEETVSTVIDALLAKMKVDAAAKPVEKPAAAPVH